MAMSGHAQEPSLLARLPMSPRRIIKGHTLIDLESRREPRFMALGHGLDCLLMTPGGQRLWCPHLALQVAQLESGSGR